VSYAKARYLCNLLGLGILIPGSFLVKGRGARGSSTAQRTENTNVDSRGRWSVMGFSFLLRPFVSSKQLCSLIDEDSDRSNLS
jgi:hypothetical protein